MKNEVCSQILLHTQCGKQSRILAKCLIGEKLQNGRSQDSEFQVIRQTTYQATTKTESEFQSHTFMAFRCDQWTKIEVGKLSDLFGQIWRRNGIFSTKRKVYITHRKASSVHEDGIISFWKEYIPYVIKNANCQLKKLYREIVLCYLLLLEVYTHR